MLARLFMSGVYLHASNLAQGSLWGMLMRLSDMVYVHRRFFLLMRTKVQGIYSTRSVTAPFHACAFNAIINVRVQQIDGCLQADLPQLSRPRGVDSIHPVSCWDKI